MSYVDAVEMLIFGTFFEEALGNFKYPFLKAISIHAQYFSDDGNTDVK